VTRTLTFVAELILWIVVALIAATVFAGGQNRTWGLRLPDDSWHVDEASLDAVHLLCRHNADLSARTEWPRC